MKRRRALAILGVVGGSGCLRLTGSSEPSTAETATTAPPSTTANTATTTTVPTTSTETQTRGELTYPSGLTADGVGEYFPEFHQSTLQSRSFTAEWSKLDRDNSEFKWRKRYEADVGHAVGRATKRAMGGPADVYRTRADGGFWREKVGSEYTYGRDNEGMEMSEVAWGDEIVPLVRAGEWSAPERVNDARPAVWEVTADSVDGTPPAPGYYDGVTLSISGSMRIDERGFIRNVEAAYRIRKSDDRGGDTRNFTTIFTVDAVGETSVSEPSWVAEARQQRPRMSAELLDDGKYLRLRHEGGSAIRSNTVLSVYDDAVDASYGLELDSPIRPNETVYLYPTDQTSTFPSMGLSRGTRPGTAPSLAFEDPADTWARRATLQYYEVRV